MGPLEVIFEDEHYIGINKPSGILVHKTPLERDPKAKFALQLLRDQIGQRVYPLHRIDRPTTGVLLFAKSSEAAALLQPGFSGNGIKKSYLTIVRGFVPEEHGMIDKPLAKDLEHEEQPALTEYWKMAETEIPFASSERYPSSRYSLVKVYPHTGRMHQIRRHFAHIRHYIIGDNTHGDNKQNKFFRSRFGMHYMLLHAWQLKFKHPVSEEQVEINAKLPDYFEDVLNRLGLKMEHQKG